jgi:hypothetical protein
VSWLKALPLLLVAPLVPYSQGRIDGLAGAFRPQEEVLYLWSGEHVKRLVPGFESLAADLYWLRTVQYFGGQRRFADDKRFELLQPLIDITTTLDPRLEVAYRYGAVFLSEAPPLGAGRPKEGVALLEKGVAALPEAWRLRQDLAFFHFLFLNDAHTASRVLLEAAEVEGAAFWLRTLAADLLAKGGDREASRRMWRQMLEQAEEGIIRDNARTRLQILDSLDAADGVARAVVEFERLHARRPARLEELVTAGLWRGAPSDAANVPFGYDETTGRVFIQEASPMWRPAWPSGDNR